MTFINVESNKHSVFAEDGRLFYDITHLIEHYDSIISNMEIGVKVIGTDEEKAYVEGQRWLLSQIQSASDLLKVKAI